jgi:2,5-diketo-D-gluconate reductase B
MSRPVSGTDEHAHVLVGEGESRPHPTLDTASPSFGEPTVATPGGLVMPKLGVGTYELAGRTVVDIVRAALDRGVRHLDTAQMYGNEADVAAGIAESDVDRRDVFITTKVANDRHEPDEMVRSVEESLDRLDTDHVDLLLVHWPVQWERMGATMATLAQIQAGGLARHVGVSNFEIDQLEHVAGLAPIEVLQAECHPFFQQEELRGWCRARGWIFTAYAPLAQGAVLDDPTLRQIGAAHDVSPAAIALNWLLAQDGVVAIPRTSSVEHLDADLAALDLHLSADELAAVAALDAGERKVDPDFAPWR